MTTAILFCNCGGKILPGQDVDFLQNELKLMHAQVFELHDMCAFAVHDKSVVEGIERDFDKKIIVACYPRAINTLFKQNNINFSNYRVLNFRENTPVSIIEKLKLEAQENNGQGKYNIKKASLKVPAWYPLIDSSRCSQCGQCANFCLFGVSKFSNKELEVINPLACKNNCPACGRTCPEGAIIFPKLAEKSFLSGADTNKKAENTSGNEKGLLIALEKRNARRKSIIQIEAVNKAKQERDAALQQLKLDKND